MDSQRALAAILFTDAVGFSGRANYDEAKALDEIERDFVVMRESCSRHDGQVLKSLGDGLLMVFNSAVQAVLCAIDIQDRLQKPTGDDPLLHRIGIHLGDVLLSASDAQGDGVNIASRLEQEAMPGGICMSGTIYDVVKSRLTVQVRSLGEKTLKNIAEPIQVYEIGPSAEAVERLTIRRKAVPEQRSMASTYAIVFLGICILGAATIYFLSNRKPDNESYFAIPIPKMGGPAEEDGSVSFLRGPVGRQIKESAETQKLALEIQNLKDEIKKSVPHEFLPPEVLEKIPKTATPPSTPATTSVGGDSDDEEDKPSSGRQIVVSTTTSDSSGKVFSNVPSVKAYEEMRKRYAPKHDFEAMLDWSSKQEWAGTVTGGLVVKHWEKLVHLKAFVLESLSKYNEKNPLKMLDGSIWSGGGTRIVIKPNPTTTVQTDWAGFPTHRITALAELLAKTEGKVDEVRPLISAFDVEYKGGGLGMLAKKIS